MTRTHDADDPSSPRIGPITDHESLRDREDVPFREQTDAVDEEIVDQMAGAPDLAGVGVTNPDGEVLFRRLTDTCSWKLPVATVAPDEDYAAAIREHVSETVGLEVTLESIEVVRETRVRTADGERTASQVVVTFGASCDSYDLSTATPAGDPVEEAGWFADRPADSSEIPGTERFVD